MQPTAHGRNEYDHIYLRCVGTPPSFSAILTRGITFMNYCLLPWAKKTPFNKGLLIKERICSFRSKFFPLKVAPMKREKKKMKELLSIKCVPVHLKSTCIPEVR